MKILKIILLTLMLGLTPVITLAGPVNINTASAKALAKNLKGVGPKAAQAIVAYRKQHGRFKTADDLTKIKGIGPKTIAKNRKNIIVGAAK